MTPDSVNSRYANLPCSPYLAVNRTQAEMAAGMTREAKAAHLRLVETGGAREEAPLTLRRRVSAEAIVGIAGAAAVGVAFWLMVAWALR